MMKGGFPHPFSSAIELPAVRVLPPYLSHHSHMHIEGICFSRPRDNTLFLFPAKADIYFLFFFLNFYYLEANYFTIL